MNWRVALTLIVGLAWNGFASVCIVFLYAIRHNLNPGSVGLLVMVAIILPGAYLTTAALVGAETWAREAKAAKRREAP